MRYADSQNSAFPLEPAARAPIAHDAIHRLYDNSRWGSNSNPNVPPIGGAARNYDAAKFAAVHAEAVRAMLDAGYNHRLRCAGSLDNSLPQELFDRSTPPPGATARRASSSAWHWRRFSTDGSASPSSSARTQRRPATASPT